MRIIIIDTPAPLDSTGLVEFLRAMQSTVPAGQDGAPRAPARRRTTDETGAEQLTKREIARAEREFVNAAMARTKASAADAVPGRHTGITDLVRQALAEGPKTNAEVADWLAKQGVQISRDKASQVLFHLRQQNEAYKRDEDLRWCLARHPEKERGARP